MLVHNTENRNNISSGMSNHCNNLCNLYHVTKSLNGHNILNLLRQGFKRCGKCLKWIQVFTKIHCPCCGKTLSMRIRSRGSEAKKTIARYITKERNRLKSVRWRNNNRKRSTEHTKIWRNKNKEYCKEYYKTWTEKNRELVRKLNSDYYYNNRDAILARRKAKYAEKKALKQSINEIPIAPLITIR